ncbi:retrovirus-related Pol polyprotein from transposon 17.6 [Trichonephila clavipes]|nr:retrovirus-related Pol polyprotein from transposon 17.6 [Trichonephila clavipes]
MSFGLKNAPYFFSKLMAKLSNGLEDFLVPYLDDIAIFSDTWESHIKHMEMDLQRIKRAKLTIKPSKCKFAQQNVKFLGHIVGQGFRTLRDQSSGCSRVPYPSHENPNTCFLRSSGLLPKIYKSILGNRCSVDGRVEGKSKEGRNYVDDEM